MTEKRIIRILFAIATVLAGGVTQLKGDVPVYRKLQLRTEYSGGADYARLRLAARRIEALLHREKSKLPPGKPLVIRSNAPQFQLICAPTLWTLHIPGAAARWSRDFQLRRQLYAAIIAARLEIVPSTGTPQLSAWLTNAIDQSIADAQSAELYLSGNRIHFEGAQFFRQYGKLPDFAQLCTQETDHFPPFCRSLCAEFSLLTAEVLAKRKLLTFQLRQELTQGAPDAWAERFSDGAANRQRTLEKDAWALVWNSRQPLPPELLAQRIANLVEFAIPELNAQGERTGKMLYCAAPEAAKQLALHTRTDAAALRRSFAFPWNELAQECDPQSRLLCRKIAAPITLFGIDAQAPEEFAAALDALKKQIARQKKLEALLNRTEREMLPVPRLWDAQLSAIASDNPALTTPDKIFLELTERDYLAE